MQIHKLKDILILQGLSLKINLLEHICEHFLFYTHQSLDLWFLLYLYSRLKVIPVVAIANFFDNLVELLQFIQWLSSIFHYKCLDNKLFFSLRRLPWYVNTELWHKAYIFHWLMCLQYYLIGCDCRSRRVLIA